MAKKTTIEIYGEGEAILENLSEKAGVSKGELITRALRVYRFVDKEVLDKNRKLAILDEEGAIEEEIEP